jgi:hypothetical protein
VLTTTSKGRTHVHPSGQIPVTVDPVFVDRSGRRRRLIVAAGVAGGLVLILAAGVLLAGLTGAGSAAAPGWPGAATSSPAPHRGAAPKRSAVPRVTTNPPVAVRVTTAPPTRSATATAFPSPTATATVTPSASAKNRGRGPSIRASKRS